LIIQPSNHETMRNNKADIIQYTPNKIEISLISSKDSILFLSDNYYPGWKAMIDGEERKIYRADYTFRAVLVPKGEHKVLFLYEPLAFKWGLWIALFSLMALAIINFAFWRSKK